MTTKLPKIAFVVTVPSALRAFFIEHICALAQEHNVTIFSNFTDDPCTDVFPNNVQLVHIPFERKIYPARDFMSILKLYLHLRRGDFDSVHSMMPKTGLLTMIAGWIAAIPVRIHTFTGQVWANKSGLERTVLKTFDRLIVNFSTHILSDSPSQNDFLAKEGVVKNAIVLGYGSVGGVNLKKFHPRPDKKTALRRKLGISHDSILFGYLGRANQDKGLLDLAQAFFQADLPTNAKLIFVGPDEDGTIAQISATYGDANGRLFIAGQTSQPEMYLNMFDVYCIPSYREGFGTSVVEAAACGIPAIGSRIYGLTDAIEANVTGILHSPGNCAEISEALKILAVDTKLREKLGHAARQRVKEKFSSSYLTAQMLEFYDQFWQ